MSLQKMLVKDLKAVLDQKQISYSSTAKKEDLIKLLEKKPIAKVSTSPFNGES
jgi:hypothetical protein